MSPQTRPVSLLAYIPNLGGGGAEIHLVRVLNALDRTAFAATLAVSTGPGKYEQFLQDDIELVRLRSGPPATLTKVRSVWNLRRLIAERKPDLVWSVMDMGNVLALEAVRGLPDAPPVVVSVQNTPSVALGGSRHPVLRLVLARLKRLYPRAAQVVALSRGVADDVSALCELPRPPVVIHNAGVDENVVQGATRPVGESVPRPLVLACGRLTEQKGYPFLLEAFRQVAREHPAAHLWILGEGELREPLEEQARMLGIHERVRFLGFRENPFAFMAACDVFVLSSLWEGFGNVVAEAMACGAPVVSTDCPFGPGEIVQDGVSGLLVPPGDASALADALGRVLADDGLRARLAAGALERAQLFTARRSAAAYECLFGDLLSLPAAS
jgi:glycosyltransferase involved in cell wall biosynthesis